MLKPFATRTHTEMKEVLRSPEAEGPEVYYYMIRGGSDKTNVTVWETGTVGGEYIKTLGHYHVGKLDETYNLIQGEGLILLQNRKLGESNSPINNELESFYIISVKAGDKVFIPSGSGHLAVNTGKIWMVTSDDSPVNFEEVDPVSLPGHADYDSVKAVHGFGYYIVQENGEAKAVANSNYTNLPEPVWMTAAEWQEKVSAE